VTPVGNRRRTVTSATAWTFEWPPLNANAERLILQRLLAVAFRKSLEEFPQPNRKSTYHP